jgi:hypothetical protein
LTRILAAGLLSAGATLGVWLLLGLAAIAVARLAGSPSPITQLVGMGLPVAAILLAPVVAGVSGGLVARRMSGLLSSIVGYVVVVFVLSSQPWQTGLFAIGLAMGIPLVIIGHWAGAAARPSQVRHT